MQEPVEQFQGIRNSTPLFRDWTPFASELIVKQLPQGTRYTPPEPNLELRSRIALTADKLNGSEELFLKSCLSFLESGMIEDDFKSDDKSRDQFALNYKITVDDKELSYYNFVQEVNKLKGIAIQRVILASQMTNDESLDQQAYNLKTKIEKIKETRGYFVPDDLKAVDNLAIQIIDFILSKKNGVEKNATG